VGGTGDSLDINQYYAMDKHLSFIAERTSNTNVGFVLRKYVKPWMNRKFRSVNLRLDRALMRGDTSYINFTDTDTIVREEDTTHGLHLNSRGKMRLTRLSAESICGGHVPNLDSSIPVITHARTSPFLS
jgi:hypothetical protein